MSAGPAIRRHVVRLVVLDPHDRVLLIRARDPADPAKGQWWELPGGGIGRGESPEAAGLRELREETGITQADVGRCVWLDEVEFTFGGWRFAQDQRYHLARVQSVVPQVATDLEALEVAAFLGREWMTATEMQSAAAAGEQFLPRWLPDALPAALAAPATAKPRTMTDRA